MVLVVLSALLIVRAADGALLRDGIAELLRSPGLLAAMLGAYATAFVLRAFAWRTLLGRAGSDAGAGRLVAILHGALLANHALPVKAGEVLRPALAVRAGVPVAGATVSTVVARLLDVAALLAIATALLPLTTAGGDLCVTGWKRESEGRGRDRGGRDAPTDREAHVRGRDNARGNGA